VQDVVQSRPLAGVQPERGQWGPRAVTALLNRWLVVFPAFRAKIPRSGRTQPMPEAPSRDAGDHGPWRLGHLRLRDTTASNAAQIRGDKITRLRDRRHDEGRISSSWDIAPHATGGRVDSWAHDLRAGVRVTYTPRQCNRELARPPLTGTVAGAPVFDRYTMETWIPVQPDGASTDTEPALIRQGNIVEVVTGRDPF
jgi:hypothetical protein